MADLMAGPGAPLTRAFISCGWSCITVDWLLDPSHDLADRARQASLSAQLEEVIFIAAALDCSTKSRAREIPRVFEDGRPAPGPLCSEAYPDGLPGLSPKDAQRIATDNQACSYVLGEIDKLCQRGGGSVRENPARSLHWWSSAEEWTPYTSEGRRVYPSKEEAEYTATLAYAISVSQLVGSPPGSG
eukprot:s1385_g35.t1